MARCRHACRVRPGVSGEEHADSPRRRRRQMCMCSLRTNVPAMTAHERDVTQKMDGHTQGSPLSVTITCLVVWQAVRPNGRGRWTPDARAD